MTKHHMILSGGIGIFIIASVLGIFFTGKPNKSDISSTELTQITESDWMQGDIGARIVLIEYADFQCPACAAYYPIIKRLEEKFGSEVVFVYRYFPLTQIHPNAELAAVTAEAAGRQGKFWEMHDLLFEHQKAWAEDTNAKEIFIGYARELGLEENQFTNDLTIKEVREKISSSYKDGILFGVTGTPTFFFNNKKLPTPRTYEEFEKIISEALNQ